MTALIIQYLLTALSVSLIITAVYACTRKGMIFYPIVNSIENKTLSFCKKKIPEMGIARQCSITICKPLFKCPVCMSSFWGFTAWVILWLVYGYYFNPILLVFLICGINTIIASIISNLFFYDEE